LLEFAALVALRIREPNLARPYRVPGGLFGVISICIPPTVLMAASIARNEAEQVGTTNELIIGTVIILVGILLYFVSPGSRRPVRPDSPAAD